MNVEKTVNIPRNWVRTFQRNLYCAAKKSKMRRFGILYDKVKRADVLEEAWRRVSRNGGSGGVDGKTVKMIEEYGVAQFLEEIREELEKGEYKPSSIRRVYIPKGDGRYRPLGIPTIREKVVQMAVKLIIEPLFEADFLPCSYGFRPKRSAHKAIREVHRRVNYRKWVVDVDLKSYFDTIPHSQLMVSVRKRVSDRKVLQLIRGWLKAGIIEEGEIRHVTSGSPQGGVLSPLLSNIYLHELDRQWDRKKGELIRYADDVILLCKSRQEAEQALREAERILGELGLTLNQEKTKICHVREGFDFLGFTFREAYSAKWKRDVRIKYPRYKSMKAIRQRIKETIKSFPTGVYLEGVIEKVNNMLRGWANYFKIGNSYAAAYGLSVYVCAQLRIFWRRRKQNKRIQGSRRWSNSFFYDKGVYYVPRLLSYSANAA